MHVIDTFTKTRRRTTKTHSFYSLDVRERNSMAITLNIHSKSHNVRDRPTLKLLERLGNGSIRELYERSIYERSRLRSWREWVRARNFCGEAASEIQLDSSPFFSRPARLFALAFGTEVRSSRGYPLPPATQATSDPLRVNLLSRNIKRVSGKPE